MINTTCDSKTAKLQNVDDQCTTRCVTCKKKTRNYTEMSSGIHDTTNLNI